MAVHWIDPSIFHFNGLAPTAFNAKKIIENDPDEQVIDGTFKTHHAYDIDGEHYIMFSVECACPELEII